MKGDQMSFMNWSVIIVLGVLWGSSFLFNEILLREVGPLTVSFSRVFLGALGCWAYAIVMRKRFTMSWALGGGMFALGAINFAIPFAIYPISQQYIASSVVGIVNAMMPVTVVLVSHFWPGGERATKTKVVGVGLGFAGICILAAPKIQSGSADLWAILFTLLAPVSYAIALNYARNFKDIDPTIIAAMALSGGAVFIAPFAYWVEGVPDITQLETWVAFGVLGFVLTSAGFIVMYWLLTRVGATNASIVTFVAPVSAVVLGVYVLGEVIEWAHVLGMGAIFCGMVVVDGRALKWIRGRNVNHMVE